MVKGAMQHAWSNYVTYAFGHDELMPRSLRGKDPFGGLGATILDSLDTLWLMGMQAEYKQARDWVAKDLNFTRYGPACTSKRKMEKPMPVDVITGTYITVKVARVEVTLPAYTCCPTAGDCPGSEGGGPPGGGGREAEGGFEFTRGRKGCEEG